MRQWRQQWSPALLAGLLNSREDLRQAVATQAIPVVLQLDTASLLHLMRAALEAPQQVTAPASMLLVLLLLFSCKSALLMAASNALQQSIFRFHLGYCCLLQSDLQQDSGPEPTYSWQPLAAGRSMVACSRLPISCT